jgi:hypothetical protein
MPRKLYEPRFNGQTPKPGGPRKSAELTDEEIQNFQKKKRAVKVSDRKKQGYDLPKSEAEAAADLELRRRQKNEFQKLMAMIKATM